MSKDLIIIGAGGDGRVAAQIVEDIGDEWNLLGYLDDDPEKQSIEINGFPVLGKIPDATKYHNCYFVILLGNPQNRFIKKRYVSKLGIDLENYATLIHPSATISKYIKIGRGSVILPGATISPNVEIGNHVYIGKAHVSQGTKIGDYVLMVNLAAIGGKVTMEEGCYIGQNSAIREGVTIGKWSLVGMGSVVVSDVPAYHVVVGNPAKILRKLDPAEFQL